MLAGAPFMTFRARDSSYTEPGVTNLVLEHLTMRARDLATSATHDTVSGSGPMLQYGLQACFLGMRKAPRKRNR